jgi:hypothetical protein
MKWETVDSLLESAKKYAAIEEDLAVKSYKDHVYWHHKVIVDLLRAMSKVIEDHRPSERQSNGQGSEAQREASGVQGSSG